MATPSQKGNALETAVAAIERHILSTSPALREKTFFIEGKKIIAVDGVHHEIDIFVTIEAGPGYRSIFIFECKNWQDPVGKNDVVVLSEKINAAQAQNGYLIAKSFTKDARAQAQKDRRVVLSIATEHDPTAASLPHGFHGALLEAEHAETTFYARGGHSEITIDIGGVEAELLGNVIDLRQYLQKWAEEASSKDVLSFRSERFPEGVYGRTAQSVRNFAPRELLLDGLDIERGETTVHYKVTLVRPPVVSYFEIETRGRVVTLAPIQIPSGPKVQMSLTSR
jgi:hypothetical protein